MLYRITIVMLLALSCGNIAIAQKAGQPSAAIDAGESTPMSCHIEGKVMKILATKDDDINSVCAKHPCKAMVKITAVQACGSSVAMYPNAGEVYEMQFAYTLHNTKHLFPGMKVVYPGLKKGQRFTARIEQRLRPGVQGGFVVYGYRRK